MTARLVNSELDRIWKKSGRGRIKGTIPTEFRTRTPRIKNKNTNTTTATLVQCVCGDSVDCVVYVHELWWGGRKGD